MSAITVSVKDLKSALDELCSNGTLGINDNVTIWAKEDKLLIIKASSIKIIATVNKVAVDGVSKEVLVLNSKL